ncbi:hypothetical protein DPEC_G00346730 [Dallia pectoralis]|uniref:Uncharacterized protein n=1 Tax=Dallia pectoralis TaxID=75939 RepID=A0ACC2F3Z6_DALPE|nr:hypothetical protein DPEC_G00346730 [Dallia pectoralis]
MDVLGEPLEHHRTGSLLPAPTRFLGPAGRAVTQDGLNIQSLEGPPGRGAREKGKSRLPLLLRLTGLASSA